MYMYQRFFHVSALHRSNIKHDATGRHVTLARVRTCRVAVARLADVVGAAPEVVVLAALAVGPGRVVAALDAVAAVTGASVQIVVIVTAVAASVTVTRCKHVHIRHITSLHIGYRIKLTLQ